MAEAGADVIGAHVGLTTGGMIGAGVAAGLDEACERIARMRDAAVAARPDTIVVAHGGPFEDPASVQGCYDRVAVHGFLGASSIERLPVEDRPDPDGRGFPTAACCAPNEGTRMGNVVLIGTLDTKGAEYAYLRTASPRPARPRP